MPQTYLKSLIAYSSVAHRGIVIGPGTLVIAGDGEEDTSFIGSSSGGGK